MNITLILLHYNWFTSLFSILDYVLQQVFESLHLIQHCSIITLEKKKRLIPSRVHCLCGFACSPRVYVGFLQVLGFFPQLKDVPVRLTGMSKTYQYE